jgi:antitoxin VapB
MDASGSLAYALTYAGEVSVQLERHVKLFKNGRNRAVRIPREFDFPGDHAIMRKEGDKIIIEPVPKKSLLELLDTLEPIEEEFPEIEDLPPEPVEF